MNDKSNNELNKLLCPTSNQKLCFDVSQHNNLIIDCSGSNINKTLEKITNNDIHFQQKFQQTFSVENNHEYQIHVTNLNKKTLFFVCTYNGDKLLYYHVGDDPNKTIDKYINDNDAKIIDIFGMFICIIGMIGTHQFK